MRFSTSTVIVVLSACLLSVPALAQDPPVGVSEVGRFDQANNYADVWGDGNFAYLARFGSNQVDIVDIANPAAPVLAATYNTGIGGASAQDVKVANGLMFIGLEGVSPGAQIVDVRDPYNPVHLTNVTVRRAIHNLFYDQGWLYLVDSSTTNVEIVDLRNYNPDNAPSEISNSTYRLSNVGNSFVHDVTAQNGRLYATAWDSLRVYDVSNLANQAPTLLGSVSGNSVHASWATDDGRYVVVAEERGGGGLTVFEIIDNGGSVDLIFRDALTLPGSQAFSTHNPLIVGNRVYVSWYEAGLQVFDIDPGTGQLDFVASFDTTALNGNNGFFDGCWGAYPFLGEDRVLASDRQNGLFILDVNPNILNFDYPDGRPVTALPDVPTPVEVAITAVGALVDGTSVDLLSSIDGSVQPPVSMDNMGADIYGGDLPAASCGSVIEFSIQADNTNGDTFMDPADGSAYRVDVVAQIDTVFQDSFSADLGWSVSNLDLTTGAWERGNPRGTGPQPENCFSGDTGTDCYFTDQGPLGGDVGDADVDGGPTRLVSPALDFSGGDGVIRYAYWFSTDDGDDDLIVHLSNNGGGNWVEARRYMNGNGGWIEDSIQVGDFVTPTMDVMIRFSISDNPNDSVTEAAIDYVRAEVFLCDEVAVNLTSDGVARGQTTTLTATGAESGESVGFLASSASGSGPCLPALGGLCLDIIDPLLMGISTADAGGTATLEIAIPVGFPLDTVYFQSAIPRGVGGANSVKSNVISEAVAKAP